MYVYRYIYTCFHVYKLNNSVLLDVGGIVCKKKRNKSNSRCVGNYEKYTVFIIFTVNEYHTKRNKTVIDYYI